MPDDLNAALERFQLFIERFGPDEMIDVDSGFTRSDAALLSGEVEMAIQTRGMHNSDESGIDDGLM